MADLSVIEAVKLGNLSAVQAALASGADINERDEHGWTPLCWAAGRGDAALVSALVASGADVTLTGRDARTPLMIARAANRQAAAELLFQAERDRGVPRHADEPRAYCKAYRLRDLRKYDRWPSTHSATQPLSDDDIIYVHQDFTVTKSMWHGEDVVFDDASPEWRTFCQQALGFALPADMS